MEQLERLGVKTLTFLNAIAALPYECTNSAYLAQQQSVAWHLERLIICPRVRL